MYLKLSVGKYEEPPEPSRAPTDRDLLDSAGPSVSDGLVDFQERTAIVTVGIEFMYHVER